VLKASKNCLKAALDANFRAHQRSKVLKTIVPRGTICHFPGNKALPARQDVAKASAFHSIPTIPPKKLPKEARDSLAAQTGERTAQNEDAVSSESLR
jgi:hypothetical protein